VRRNPDSCRVAANEAPIISSGKKKGRGRRVEGEQDRLVCNSTSFLSIFKKEEGG